MKNKCFLFYTCVIIVLLGSCNSSNKSLVSTFDKIKSEKVLNIGYVVYSPIVKKDPNTGEVSGHFVDAIKFIAEEMGVKPIFHEADWATFSTGLQSGKYDVCIAPTYSTIKRSIVVGFTNPIMYMGSSAVIRKSDMKKFKTIEDINKEGVTISVVQGEGNNEFAKRELPLSILKTISTANMSLPIVDVVSNNADVALTDYYTAKQFVEKNPSVMMLSDIPFDLLPIGWAVRPSDVELLNFLNNSIDYLEVTGRMTTWEKKYNTHWVKTKKEYYSN